jgi:hypothetical protein
MTARPRKRRTVRSLVDLAAVLGAMAVTYGASQALWLAILSGGMTGLYGLWCFFDGLNAQRRTAAME